MEKKLYERIGEEVFRATLPNGLPVYIVPKKGFSQICPVRHPLRRHGYAL